MGVALRWNSDNCGRSDNEDLALEQDFFHELSLIFTRSKFVNVFVKYCQLFLVRCQISWSRLFCLRVLQISRSVFSSVFWKYYVLSSFEFSWVVRCASQKDGNTDTSVFRDDNILIFWWQETCRSSHNHSHIQSYSTSCTLRIYLLRAVSFYLP